MRQRVSAVRREGANAAADGDRSRVHTRRFGAIAAHRLRALAAADARDGCRAAGGQLRSRSAPYVEAALVLVLRAVQTRARVGARHQKPEASTAVFYLHYPNTIPTLSQLCFNTIPKI